MTNDEQNALRIVETLKSADDLRTMFHRARGKHEEVATAAFRRLVALSAGHPPGTVEHACWEMVHTIEELRRAMGRKVWRMNHMRPKIDRDGEVAALEYCVLRETPGFREIIEYGLPELTAEAIVLRYKGSFSDRAVTAARERLQSVGALVAEASTAP